MPGALASHAPSSSSVAGHSPGSTSHPTWAVSPLPHFQLRSPPSARSASAGWPQAAHGANSSETSLRPTFARSTNLRRCSRSGGDRADGVGWSIRNALEAACG